MQSSRSKSRMASATSGSEGDVDTDAESQKYRDEDVLTNASDRIKHMSFMMAILHRCLQEGDIIRAKRAFSLLIRTKDVDIRLNEMWSLGTEILMRHGSTIDLQSPEGVDDTGSGGTSHSNAAASRPYPRWGSARNIHKVRDYLETLSQHYPYDSNYPRSTSAIDFWPALYSIEIYNVDIECKRTLHRLEESSAMNEDDSMIDPPELYTETEDYDTAMQRREDDRVSKRWAAKDEIRHTAQEAAQAIAERLDNLMQTNPFTTHIELLRLRGMLALYIGDLNLPSRLLDRGGAEDNNIGSRLQSLSLNDHVRKSAQNQEERDAVRRREAEIERARGFFGRIIERGGELPAWLLKFLDPDEDEASILS